MARSERTSTSSGVSLPCSSVLPTDARRASVGAPTTSGDPAITSSNNSALRRALPSSTCQTISTNSSPPSPDRVRGAHIAAQNVRDEHQGAVARDMAVAVVDRLERVEVDQKQGGGRLVAGREGDGARQVAQEAPAVE